MLERFLWKARESIFCEHFIYQYLKLPLDLIISYSSHLIVSPIAYLFHRQTSMRLELTVCSIYSTGYPIAYIRRLHSGTSPVFAYQTPQLLHSCLGPSGPFRTANVPVPGTKQLAHLHLNRSLKSTPQKKGNKLICQRSGSSNTNIHHSRTIGP